MLQTVLFAKDEKKRQEVTMGTESNAEYGADQIQILEGKIHLDTECETC